MRLWFHMAALVALLSAPAAASEAPDTYAPARAFAEAYAARAPRAAAPQTPLIREHGPAAALGDWRGGPVLVVFWATWCPVCREEMPKVAALAESLGPQGPRIVAVSVDRGADAPAKAARHLAAHGLTALSPFVDAGLSGAAALGLRAIPTAVFIDAEGRVAGVIEGRARWDEPALLAHLEALAR